MTCLTYAAGISFFLTISALPLATLFFKLMALVLGNQAYSQTMQRAIGQIYPYLPGNVLGDAVRQSRQMESWGLGWLVLIIGAPPGGSISWTVPSVISSACASRSTARHGNTTSSRRLAIVVGGTSLPDDAPDRWLRVDLASSGAILPECPCSRSCLRSLVLIVGTQVLQHLPRRHVRFRHRPAGRPGDHGCSGGRPSGVSGGIWPHTPTWGILYGTLGSLMAGLVFLYYSCCIFLLGAEVTAAFYRHDTTMNVRVPDELRQQRL